VYCNSRAQSSLAEFAIRREFPSSKIQIPKNLQCVAGLNVEAFQIGLSLMIEAWKLDFSATFTVAVG
jgi:hypothetical protein